MSKFTSFFNILCQQKSEAAFAGEALRDLMELCRKVAQEILFPAGGKWEGEPLVAEVKSLFIKVLIQ